MSMIELLVAFVLLLADYAIGSMLSAIWDVLRDLGSFDPLERILVLVFSGLVLVFSAAVLFYEWNFFTALWARW